MLPDFVAKGVLKKNASGNVQYDFGPGSRIDDTSILLTVNEDELLNKVKDLKNSKKKKKTFPGTLEKMKFKKRRMISTPV